MLRIEEFFTNLDALAGCELILNHTYAFSSGRVGVEFRSIGIFLWNPGFVFRRRSRMDCARVRRESI
jgi:hypothetical protein